LAEAQTTANYYQLLETHPDKGGLGPSSRRKDLERALTKVGYRRRLLDELQQ